MNTFKMGTLDHMHVMVPNRYEAARWYQENLGFEIIKEFEFWAKEDSGPLYISADGGRSALSLFEPNRYVNFKVETSVAFRVDAEAFLTFARSLNTLKLKGERGNPLTVSSVVDHNVCYAFYFQDPYGNQFELDCYECDRIREELIERDGITPVRWG
jgi:catechol-2,3-dioxygenase